MKKCVMSTFIFFVFIFSTLSCLAAPQVSVGGILCPDPLYMEDGTRVDSVEKWENERRPELLNLFAEHIYGHPLPQPLSQSFKTETTEYSDRIRKLVYITVEGPYGEKTFTLRVFLPISAKTKPVPLFLHIDNRGISTNEPYQSEEFFPLNHMIDRGYGMASIHVTTLAAGKPANDIAPDDADKFRDGVINLFFPASSPLPANQGKTISAWAWAASRCMDYFIGDDNIDPDNIAVIGHSRGGKASLLAGARDTRFAYVVSNNSGTTGAAIARSVPSGAETVKLINDRFPHWFCDNYKKFNNNENALPVDQHQLISLIAPRKVYVASAHADANAGPRNEFYGLIGAQPTYDLYDPANKTEKTYSDWTTLSKDTSFTGGAMGYHLRTGIHELFLSDWDKYADFFGGSVEAELLNAVRINCGAAVSYTGSKGDTYTPDIYYSGGSVGSRTQVIGNTEDMDLYRTFRFANLLSYNIPMQNGNYLVTLRFMENYWTTTGARLFSIKAESETVLNNLDIFALAGNKQYYAVDRNFYATVTDNFLNLEFAASKDNAIINAISAVPLDKPEIRSVSDTAVSVSINNYNGVDINDAELVVAAYDISGKMTAMNRKTISIGNNSTENVTIDIDCSGGSIIRAFLWEDLYGMKPLLESAEKLLS